MGRLVERQVIFNRWEWKITGGGYFQVKQRKLVHGIRYHKFVVLYEETGLHLTFSFFSFKIEFNPFAIRQPKVGKQLSTVNNIFNASTYFSFSEGIEKVP